MLVFTMFAAHGCIHKPNGSVTLGTTGTLEYSAPGALFVRFDRSRAISSKMNTYKNCLLSGVECALTKLHDLKRDCILDAITVRCPCRDRVSGFNWHRCTHCSEQALGSW